MAPFGDSVVDLLKHGHVWIQEPPSGPEPGAPVETRTQSLPLGELSWQNFERLVLRIVRRESQVIDCSIYGAPGQSQGGIDIIAVRSGASSSKVCYQCKKVNDFDASDVASAVDKFISGHWAKEVAEFVLCVSSSLEKTQLQNALDKQRKKLAALGIGFSVWDGAAAGGICERLKAHCDIVDDFFGRSWVSSFNGKDAADSLGDRLNGYEFGMLRSKLANLYSVLFSQHDPGFRTDRNENMDYRDRYVVPDIIERTQIDTGLFNQSAMRGLSQEEDALGISRGQEVVGPLNANSTMYEIRKPVFEWLRDRGRCVVLGEPGYGKSALLRYLALSILRPDKLQFDVLNFGYFSRLPIWISFSRLSASIGRESGVSVDAFFREWLQQYGFGDVYPLFRRAVKGGQVLLLVDGLDESTEEYTGREALDRVVTFLEASDSSIICTGRPQSYGSLGIPPSWATATLAPLSEKKIEELATRWFEFLESDPEASLQAACENEDFGRRRAQAFLREASSSSRTLELARNPLLCMSLIQLFRFSHQLPEARVEAYKQIVDLLLSKHPAARAQASGTTLPISSLGLKSADLREMLIRLAREMQSQPTRSLSEERCEQVCTDFLMDDMYGLGEPVARARRIAAEAVIQLNDQYGVLVERSPKELSLLHLSIQEYLAAESVARESHEDQIAWMTDIWISPAWRETLIAWFGILGARGEMVLSGRASQRLEDLGEGNEWLRAQSIELRMEIAISDLGLPIGEARRIVELAVSEVENSPIVELRVSLAKNIAIGALGTRVRSECRSAIRRWLPGQPSYKRRMLIASFKDWAPSTDLWSTLVRALRDEDVMCRRAAAETIAHVFMNTDEALAALERMAIVDVRPEVRAAALYGLTARSEWRTQAIGCAGANRRTANVDLFLGTVRTRVKQGLQTAEDINRILMLWDADSLEFQERRDAVGLLCEGWPQDLRLRRLLLDRLNEHGAGFEVELPLQYLVRCCPGDTEVAETVAAMVRRFGRMLTLGDNQVWEDLSSGFRGNANLSSAIRDSLSADRERYKKTLWDPRTAHAMVIIGDDAAKRELLESYELADIRGRYWIAFALQRGWGDDSAVRERLQYWADGSIEMAAPLGSLARVLFSESTKRLKWLRRIARASAVTREVGAAMALLEECPDEETKELVRDLLDNPGVWYYHRTDLQARFASAYPDDPKSLEIIEDSLSNIDGPNFGRITAMFENVPDLRSRLLDAAAPAPSDVRIAVATIFRERAIELDSVVELTPLPLAEEDSAVRASYLMARARAAKGDSVLADQLEQFLMPEFNATGTYMDMRRRTALAALLELGAYSRIVSQFAGDGGIRWTHGLIDRLGHDLVSPGAVIEHWEALNPLLIENNARENELPVAEFVRSGYDALFERTPALERLLGDYFETQVPDLIGAAYFDAFARHRPRSRSLRLLLVNSIGRNGRADVACAAARVLASHFSGNDDIWGELSTAIRSPQDVSSEFADGVLGHLALGWPEGIAAAWARSLKSAELAKLGLRNRLLVAILKGSSVEAESAVIELIEESMESWRYRTEDVNVLHIWAKWDGAKASLDRLAKSDNSSHSITAISLLSIAGRDVEGLIETLIDRYNLQFSKSFATPEDGLNAALGRQASWAISVYSTLKAWAGVSGRVAATGAASNHGYRFLASHPA